DLLQRWLRRHGRPVALYTDRHNIFEPQDKGRAVPEAVTQFGRALAELDVELIRAHSPQAKGRLERSFGTAQDRWVKELRGGGGAALAGGTPGGGVHCVRGRVPPAPHPPLRQAVAAVRRPAPAAGPTARPGGDPVAAGGACRGQRLHDPLPQPLLPAAAAG